MEIILPLDLWYIIIPFLNINDYDSSTDVLDLFDNIRSKSRIQKEWEKHTKYETKQYPDRTEWYRNGELHRDDDNPAVVRANGTKYWGKNGKLHRDDDKPAIKN